MKKLLPLWLPLMWFVLAGYVIWRVVTAGAPLDAIVAAWAGGVISLQCALAIAKMYNKPKV